VRPAPLILLTVFATVVVVADQVTKAFVRSTVDLGEEAPGIGPFSLHHVRNSGILGGHLEGSALPLAIVTTIALAGLVVYTARQRATRPTILVALGLVLGGGLGNLVDRLRLGYVTDFIDRSGGGAFNLADVAITLGLALVLIGSLSRWRSPRDRSDVCTDPSQSD
jgi:signal peptidase II